MEHNEEFDRIRCGRFNSSEIYNLCSNGRSKGDLGKAFYSYCKRKAAERMLGFSRRGGSSLDTDFGHVAEKYIGEELQSTGEYIYGYSDIPITHYSEEFEPYWSGSPDMLSENCVWDIKCPTSPEHIFNLIGCDEYSLKEDKPEYFWQLVSNSILTRKRYAGLTVFIPIKEDLEAILTMNRDNILSYRIEYAEANSFPQLGNGRENMRLYQMKWLVNLNDKEFLIDRVRQGIKEVERLIEQKTKILKL
jgi:hypothetical protein